jgi:hypothetical protein
MDIIEKLMLQAETKAYKLHRFVLPKLESEILKLQTKFERTRRYADEIEKTVKLARQGDAQAVDALVQYAFTVAELSGKENQ